VGEYVGRIYEQVRQRPRYTVAAVLEQDGERAAAQLPHLPSSGSLATQQLTPAERVPGAVE
jgi:hypothetical protein